MGISLHATVKEALAHRKRKHIVDYLNHIETALDEVRLHGMVEVEDTVLWKRKGGRFTANFRTKETWESFRESRGYKDCSKGVWFTQSIPKYSFITWLTVLNKLSTGERMQSCSGATNTSCVLCSNCLEFRDHLFSSCPYSAEIWTDLTLKLLTSNFSTIWADNLAIISDAAMNSTTLYLVRFVFQATIHTLWRERNRRRHGETPTPAPLLINQLDQTVRDKLLSINTRSKGKYEAVMAAWLTTRYPSVM